MPELKQGHRRTVRHGPKPASGWITDPPIEQTDGTVTLTLGEPDPPPPPSGEDPWGLSLMPLRSGWRTAFYTNFTEDGDINLGNGLGPHLLSYWKPRRAMGDSSGRGTYDDRMTWSQRGGIGDVFLHSGSGLAHDPSSSKHWVFALVDQVDRPEVIVQWTEKCPTTPGRKQAPLFWAFGRNDNGEDDHYEHKYGTGPRSNSFHHHYMKQSQDGIQLNVVTTDPHVLGMYFRAKGHRGSGDPGEFSTYVDGQLRKTFTTDCTPNPMHWVMQIETYLKADPLPSTASSGHVQFTQLRVEIPA